MSNVFNSSYSLLPAPSRSERDTGGQRSPKCVCIDEKDTSSWFQEFRSFFHSLAPYCCLLEPNESSSAVKKVFVN